MAPAAAAGDKRIDPPELIGDAIEHRVDLLLVLQFCRAHQDRLTPVTQPVCHLFGEVGGAPVVHDQTFVCIGKPFEARATDASTAPGHQRDFAALGRAHLTLLPEWLLSSSACCKKEMTCSPN